jgi:hypothetical protein
VAGRAAATWSVRDGEVALDPFGRLPPRAAAELDSDADDVLRFLGATPG